MEVLLSLLLHEGALSLHGILQSLHGFHHFAADFQLSFLHHGPQHLLVLQLWNKRNQPQLPQPARHRPQKWIRRNSLQLSTYLFLWEGEGSWACVSCFFFTWHLNFSSQLTNGIFCLCLQEIGPFLYSGYCKWTRGTDSHSHFLWKSSQEHSLWNSVPFSGQPLNFCKAHCENGSISPRLSYPSSPYV